MTTFVINKQKEQPLFFNFLLRFITLGKSIKKQTFLIYILFFLTSIALVSVFDKATLHLTLNKYHSLFFDGFFKYSTFLGDGILFGVLVIIFFFIKKRMSLVFAIGGVLTLLITHLLKKVIFSGVPRPAGYIGLENLHIVDGVKMAFSNSFPSGHTTTAFAIFTILCLFYSKCKSQYLWISLALIAGLSRVYLSQHFWIDIFVGSFIGIVIGFLSMAFFCKPTNRVH